MSGPFAVIIPAAGKSSRFGGREKKPFVSLDGRPVWLRATELFWTRDDVSKVYLVISPEDREEFRTRFGHLIAFANADVIEGGTERFDSVANALTRIAESVEYVAVHDAVRPLTPHAVIDAVFAAARKHGAAMPAIPVADTLKQVDPSTNQVTATIPRDGLWQAQTPQVFRRDWIVEAYSRRNEFNGRITDDAQLVEALGHAVTVVLGSPINFKITRKDDLDLAEAVLRSLSATKGPSRPAAAFDDEAKW
jgi:2-C-methyl-D-erythritol 4-phosphate cytidylyltransferase